MISQNCIFYRISKQCMVFKPNSMSGVGRRPELGSLGAGHLTNARQTNGSDLSLSDVLVTQSLGFRAGFGNYMLLVTGGAGRVGI